MSELAKLLQRADNALDAALYVIGMLYEYDPLTQRQHDLLNLVEVATTRAQQQLQEAQQDVL